MESRLWWAAAPAVALLLGAAHAHAIPPSPAAHATASSKLGLDAMIMEVGPTKIALVRVAAGTFMQGAPAADELHEASELPAHKTIITNDFYLAETPTTRAQFEAFVADSGYRTEAERGSSGGWGWNGSALVQSKEYTWRNPGFAQTESDPVVLVTYDDALAFASWASNKTGNRVRLPTEAEYELAARAGTTTRWYSGDDKASAIDIGWFKDNAGHGTKPVAKKKANALGLFDMSGNVWEWCADAFAPYSAVPATDPLVSTGEAGQPLRRVLRGGSWLKDSSHARSSARYRNTPGSRNADNGFRVAVDLSTSPAAQAHKPLLPSAISTSDLSTPPPPPSTPTPTPPMSDKTEWSVGAILLAFGGGVVAVLAAVWLGLRRSRRAALSSLAEDEDVGTSITTRNGADGFYVIAPALVAGSRVEYQCLVGGAWQSGVVAVSGAETFVYTGTPPQQVRIMRSLSAAAPAWRKPAQPASPPPRAVDMDYSSSSSSSGSFLGNPRAY